MKYIVKRILQAIPLLLIITFICFMLINLAPYDAIDAITTPDMSQQEVEALYPCFYNVDFLNYFP